MPFKKTYLRIKNSYSFVPLMKKFRDYEYEVFLCVALNKKKQVIATHTIKGGPSEVQIDYEEVLNFLKLAKATYFVLLHNHPGANEGISVSSADDQVTYGFFAYFRNQGYTMLDHLVFGKEWYFSYFDSYVMKKYNELEENNIRSKVSIDELKQLIDSDYMNHVPKSYYKGLYNDY